MNAISAIIIAVIVVAAVFAARHMMSVYFGKTSCCGSGSDSHGGARGRKERKAAARAQQVVVTDTDEGHYPYREELTIGGMTCEHCQHTVEGAINALPGLWATVDLGSRTATVRGKSAIDLSAVEQAVGNVGYYVIHQPRMSA